MTKTGNIEKLFEGGYIIHYNSEEELKKLEEEIPSDYSFEDMDGPIDEWDDELEKLGFEVNKYEKN